MNFQIKNTVGTFLRFSEFRGNWTGKCEGRGLRRRRRQFLRCVDGRGLRLIVKKSGP